MSKISKLNNRIRDALGNATFGMREYARENRRDREERILGIHNDDYYNGELSNAVDQLINENSFLTSELEKCLNNNIPSGRTPPSGLETLARIRSQTSGGKKLKKKSRKLKKIPMKKRKSIKKRRSMKKRR